MKTESMSMPCSLMERLDARFAALAAISAVTAVGGLDQKAEASVVYSGIVNINVTPTGTNGLYLNIVTGAVNEPGNTTGSHVPGWDINLYNASPTASSFTFYGSGNPGWTYVAGPPVGTTLEMAPLVLGALIDGTTSLGTGSAKSDAFPVGGSGSYFGFRFQNEANGNQLEYGWGRYIPGGVGIAGTIVDYAYENTGAGITAGTTPSPSAGMAVLALGGAGLLRRRRVA